MTLEEFIIISFWIILPAYIANASAVFVRNGHPIDMNKTFFDGNPILGKGKTFEGFGIAILMAGICGYIQTILYSINPWLPRISIVDALIIGFFAMIGDMFGSFLKRRIGLKRGESFPILDQDDFVIGALFALFMLNYASISIAIFLILITPLIHLLTNIFAYIFRIKSVPY